MRFYLFGKCDTKLNFYDMIFKLQLSSCLKESINYSQWKVRTLFIFVLFLQPQNGHFKKNESCSMILLTELELQVVRWWQMRVETASGNWEHRLLWGVLQIWPNIRSGFRETRHKWVSFWLILYGNWMKKYINEPNQPDVCFFRHYWLIDWSIFVAFSVMKVLIVSFKSLFSKEVANIRAVSWLYKQIVKTLFLHEQLKPFFLNLINRC